MTVNLTTKTRRRLSRRFLLHAHERLTPASSRQRGFSIQTLRVAWRGFRAEHLAATGGPAHLRS